MNIIFFWLGWNHFYLHVQTHLIHIFPFKVDAIPGVNNRTRLKKKIFGNDLKGFWQIASSQLSFVEIVIVGQFVTVFAVAELAKNVSCYPILSCKRLPENISDYFPRTGRWKVYQTYFTPWIKDWQKVFGIIFGRKKEEDQQIDYSSRIKGALILNIENKWMDELETRNNWKLDSTTSSGGAKRETSDITWGF